MPEPIHPRIEKIRLWAKDPDRTASHILVTILVVFVAVILALWIVWIVPQQEVARSMDAALQHDRAKQLELENEFRKTLTQIVLSIFGLFILYFTWQRARTGDKTVQIMEQGHITDRYTKAIEQLGKLDGDKPNIEIRLGAIYALERIAHDSPRDHWTIMEVLTAYVRQNSPAAPEGELPEKPLPEKPRTDIQAILTVLGRRLVGPKRERHDQRLDLTSTHLQGVNLARADLRNASLKDANLQGAFLFAANLQGASLFKVNLRGAYLRYAEMQGAFLIQTDLRDANLNEADLEGASLTEAEMQGASFYKANLQRVFLTKANLQDAKDLTPDQIRSAKSWESATFSDDLRESLGLPSNDPVEESQ
jgi:hypothetical protein